MAQHQVAIIAVGNKEHARAEYLVQPQIGRSALWLFTGEHKDALKSKARGGGRSLTAMIRLQCPASDQGLRTLLTSFRDQEFQFASLIPAKGKSGLVVAFHEQPRSAQDLGKTRKRLDRGRQVGEM
jgi:hypothetical protein